MKKKSKTKIKKKHLMEGAFLDNSKIEQKSQKAINDILNMSINELEEYIKEMFFD